MSTQTPSSLIGEVLRQPDDLLKLASYRKKLLKEKSSLDAKLSTGVKAQLDATRDALLKLQNSRAAMGLIREEMMAVETLMGGEDGGEAFDKITRVSFVRSCASLKLCGVVCYLKGRWWVRGDEITDQVLCHNRCQRSIETSP